MDRDTVLEISKKFYLKGENLTTNEMNNIISSYCVEKGKKYADIQLLLLALYKNPIIMGKYFVEALTYFEKKFTIFKLLSKPSINPTNILDYNERTILLIY